MNDIPDGFLPDLMALLEIPGIAAREDGGPALDQAANWLRERIARAGLHASLLPGVGGPPYVYAQTEQRPERPTMLLYGHYDVQPASMADGWTSDPFRPALRDGRVYARGATDQKMNLLLPIAAMEAVGVGNLPWNIKLFYEGEEEILSPHLDQALLRYRDLLGCDIVFSTDGWQHSATEGDLRLGLRGFCSLDITVFGTTKELHSGTFGGAVPNSAQALARALGRLHDDDGAIAVPGFLDGAAPPTEAERRVWLERPFDREGWLARAGLTGRAVPADLAVGERTGLHPTIEIHALSAGNYEAGLRTIVPRSASARISCRLVPGQDPDVVADLVRDFVDRAIPPVFERRIQPLPGRAYPYRIARDDPFQQMAAAVLAAVDGCEPRYSYSGGSIPMPGAVAAALGVGTVIFGFGLPDENMHGIDEFCRLADIRRGLAAWERLLSSAGPRSASASA